MNFAEIQAAVKQQTKPFEDAAKAAELMRQWAAGLDRGCDQIVDAIRTINGPAAADGALSIRASLDLFDERLIALQAALRELAKSDLLQKGGKS